MNEFFNKLRVLRPTNENWVYKILKKRIYKPVYIALIISICVFCYNLYISYVDASVYSKREQRVIQDTQNEKKKLKTLTTMINNQNKKILYLQGLHVDSKEPVMILKKVFDLLKARDVIGPYYIKKKINKKFANVLNIKIDISHGDTELALLVTKIVLDKVFYLKNISLTEEGIICELFKPSK